MQVDQGTSGRKRQRLQEDHLLVESVFKNFVLAKKAPRGYVGLIYQCLKCNSDFPTRIICIRHALKCGKAFTGKKRGKNTRQITCNICPFKTTTETKLEKHRREAHSQVSRRVRCLTCNDTFASVKILKKHIISIHKNTTPHQCKFCEKKFSQKSNLNRHMDIHLGDQGQKERDRLTFRRVDLLQWEESLGDTLRERANGGVNQHVVGSQVEEPTSRDRAGGEVDQDVEGSEVDEDPDPFSASSECQGFSVNELTDAFIERCRQRGDSEEVLDERRRTFEARLVQKVSPSTSSPCASTLPASSTPPQVGLLKVEVQFLLKKLQHKIKT